MTMPATIQPFRLTILAASVALAACAPLPSRDAQIGIKPASQYASEKSFAAPARQWPAESWWTVYGDAQLDTLIDEALAGSPSIAVAEARLHRAQANAQISRAATLPQLNANGSITEQRQSDNYLSPRSGTPQGWNDYGRATLDFSWELDFWGKNRAALAAATSEADAVRADAAQARLTLATSIASSLRRTGASARRARYRRSRAASARQDRQLVSPAACQRARNARQRAPGRIAPRFRRRRRAGAPRTNCAATQSHRVTDGRAIAASRSRARR